LFLKKSSCYIRGTYTVDFTYLQFVVGGVDGILEIGKALNPNYLIDKKLQQKKQPAIFY